MDYGFIIGLYQNICVMWFSLSIYILDLPIDHSCCFLVFLLVVLFLIFFQCFQFIVFCFIYFLLFDFSEKLFQKEQTRSLHNAQTAYFNVGESRYHCAGPNWTLSLFSYVKVMLDLSKYYLFISQIYYNLVLHMNVAEILPT